MHASTLGRGYNLFRIDLAETGDVFADSSAKQFDILWQITNIWTEFSFVPLVNVSTIETNLTHHCGPHADQQARKRRLTRAARANYAQHITSDDAEAQVAHDWRSYTRW